MAKNSVADLLNVDSLFATQAERDEAKRKTVIDIPMEEISDFPNHPFKVRMDDSMAELADSVKQYGVLVPALVRPKPDGGYEMVTGHRRLKVSELAGKATISCIVRDLCCCSFFLTYNYLNEKFLKSGASLLERLKERISPGWLKAVERVIYNSGWRIEPYPTETF